MTRILSPSTLKQLSRSTLTRPTRESTTSSPQKTTSTDAFETKKTSALRRDGDVFVAPTSPPKKSTSLEKDPGEQVVDLARSVMGQNAHDLKLANETTLGDAMQDWVGDTVNCANFVSGLLVSTGQIPKSEGNAGVTSLVANLQQDPNFTQTTLDQAVPGDVVAFEYTRKNGTTGHHVVVFAGRDEQGQPKFIGSDNVNPDGTQAVHESTGVKSGRRILAVMHYSGAAPTTTDPTAPVSPPKRVAGSSTLRSGASGPAVTELQQALTSAGFNPGPVDGSFGPKTQAAVRAYQQAKGLEVDGIVGPQTRASLLGQTTDPVPGDGEVTTDPTTPPSGTTATARELEALALQKHGPEFVQKVKEMAGRLGLKTEWVLAVMKNESAMSPTARNPNGGATGLIQFMPSTARGLGTTTSALSKMSATEQLEYVEKYYAPFKGKVDSGTDLYLATFWPAGVGKPDSYNIGGAEVARVNKIFDLDKNGQITAGEFREYYRKRFPELS